MLRASVSLSNSGIPAHQGAPSLYLQPGTVRDCLVGASWGCLGRKMSGDQDRGTASRPRAGGCLWLQEDVMSAGIVWGCHCVTNPAGLRRHSTSVCVLTRLRLSLHSRPQAWAYLCPYPQPCHLKQPASPGRKGQEETKMTNIHRQPTAVLLL